MDDNVDYYTAKARIYQFPVPARFSPFQLMACLPFHGTTPFITLHACSPLRFGCHRQRRSRFQIRQTYTDESKEDSNEDLGEWIHKRSTAY